MTQTVVSTGVAEALHKLAHARDARAWETVLKAHGADILSASQSILHDRALAEDAVQETLLRVRDSAVNFQAPSNGADVLARRWIVSIACRTALELARKERRAKKREQQYVNQSVDTSSQQDETRALIREEVHKLPLRERNPIVLHYWGGLTYAEVAAELGCPEGTARSNVSRGLERLRQRLALLGCILGPTGLGEALQSPALQPLEIQTQLQTWQQVLYSANSAPAGALPHWHGGLSPMAKLGIGASLLACVSATILVLALNAAETSLNTRQLIQQLKSEDYQVRQLAEVGLEARGMSAAAEVEQALADKDPEMQTRLRRIRLKIYSDAASRGVAWKKELPTRQGAVSHVFGCDRTILVVDGDRTARGLDAETGEPRWALTLDCFVQSMATEKSMAYGCGADGALKGQAFALDASAGKLIWQQALPGAATAVALQADRLYVLTRSGHLLALQPQTGKQIWSVRLEEFQDGEFRKGAHALALARHKDATRMVASLGIKLFVVDDQGQRQWQTELSKPIGSIQVGPALVYAALNQEVSACPNKQGQVDAQMYVHAFALDSGEEKWQHCIKTAEWKPTFTPGAVDKNKSGLAGVGMSVPAGPMVIHNDELIGSAQGWLFGLDAESGKERWSVEVAAWDWQTLQASNSKEEGISIATPPQITALFAREHNVYFSSSTGGFNSLDLQRRSPLWRYEVKDFGIFAACLHQGNVVIAACKPGLGGTGTFQQKDMGTGMGPAVGWNNVISNLRVPTLKAQASR